MQLYCEWRYQIHAGIFDGSFTQFLGTLPWGPNPRIFGVVGYHLWFLGFLFSFSLLALPLFRWLQGESGRRFVSRLARVCQYRGGILIFVLPPVIARLSLQPFFPYEHDWADFFFLFSFFVIGCVVMSDERFRQAVRRDWPITLTRRHAGLHRRQPPSSFRLANSTLRQPHTHRWTLSGGDWWPPVVGAGQPSFCSSACAS